jgi:hypothetical protein
LTTQYNLSANRTGRPELDVCFFNEKLKNLSVQFRWLLQQGIALWLLQQGMAQKADKNFKKSTPSLMNKTFFVTTLMC